MHLINSITRRMIAFGNRKKKADDKSNKEHTHSHTHTSTERVSKENPMPKWK